MDVLHAFDHEQVYRTVESPLPDNPVSLPYDLRGEMTWIDFSNPMNPLGVPRPFVSAMHTALVDGALAFAPDRDGHALRNALGDALGLGPEWVLAGSSATQLICTCALAFPCTTVGISAPCPPEYISAVCNAGHAYVSLVNKVTFSAMDAYTARREVGDFEGVLLGNPMYPASRLLSRENLIHYLETSDWVIVDESYIELSFGSESVVPLVGKYQNLMVIRSLSATFAMPGVPIGYLVAHPRTIERIRRYYDGTSISMFAEVLAHEFVSQDAYLDETHDFLEREIPWMQCMLHLVPGVTIFPAEGNFVLCEFAAGPSLRLGVTCADELVVRLQLAGFLVRRVEQGAGIPSDGYFCVSVRSHEENERLLAALRHIVSG